VQGVGLDQSSDTFETVFFQNSTLRRYVFSSAIATTPPNFSPNVSLLARC
jgi:hypothetical protein